VAEVFPDRAMVESTPLQSAVAEDVGILEIIRLVEVHQIHDPQVLRASIHFRHRSVLELETSDLEKTLECMMEMGQREEEVEGVDIHTDSLLNGMQETLALSTHSSRNYAFAKISFPSTY